MNPSVTPGAGSAAGSQYATFHLAGHFYGLDVLEVQEVLREQRLTRVPLAPPTVEGLLNLRGQIVVALDLRRVLNLPPRTGTEPAMSIVAQTAEGPVSLQVDDIGDVVEAAPDTFEAPPENLPAAAKALIRGVHKLNDRLLLVLDTRRVACARTGEEINPGSPEQDRNKTRRS